MPLQCQSTNKNKRIQYSFGCKIIWNFDGKMLGKRRVSRCWGKTVNSAHHQQSKSKNQCRAGTKYMDIIDLYCVISTEIIIMAMLKLEKVPCWVKIYLLSLRLLHEFPWSPLTSGSLTTGSMTVKGSKPHSRIRQRSSLPSLGWVGFDLKHPFLW